MLGTTTYEDVLFNADAETPINVRIGEPPARSQVSVEEANAFAEELAGDTPYVALPSSVETQVGTDGPPYTAGVFYHSKRSGRWSDTERTTLPSTQRSSTSSSRRTTSQAI